RRDREQPRLALGSQPEFVGVKPELQPVPARQPLALEVLPFEPVVVLFLFLLLFLFPFLVSHVILRFVLRARDPGLIPLRPFWHNFATTARRRRRGDSTLAHEAAHPHAARGIFSARPAAHRRRHRVPQILL